MRFKTHLHHLQDFLAGRKTYIVAMAGIVALAIGWYNDAVTTPNTIEQMVALVLAMCIRQGVSHEAKKAKAPVADVAPPVALTAVEAPQPVPTATEEQKPLTDAPVFEKSKKKFKNKKGKHG